MAIAFDAASSDRVESGPGTNTLTFAHTVGSGSDRALAVPVTSLIGGSIPDVTSVTFNGDAMTAIVGWNQVNSGGDIRTKGYRLIAPDIGTFNVVITMAGNVNIIAAGAVSFFGVDQTTPIRGATSATANDDSPTLNISSAVGDVVIDGLVAGYLTLAAGADQTTRWEEEALFTTVAAAGGSTEPGDTTVTMSWTLTTIGDVGDVWVLGAASIQPAAAAGGAPEPSSRRMGGGMSRMTGGMQMKRRASGLYVPTEMRAC